MKRGLLGTIVWTVLAACIGVGLFFVKHEVKDQERRLNALNAEIQRNQETIHVLRAEWSFLNDPTRLRLLAEKHLGMHPVRASEVATLDSVLRDGVPAGVMMAAARPQAAPAQTAAAPRQPVKLADGPAKPRPNEATRPPAPKPQPPKTTMAKTETPPPSAPQVGQGRTIVIKSPSLAQTDGGAR